MAGCNFCVDIDEPGLYKPYRTCKTINGELCDACMKIQRLETRMAEAKKVMDALFEQHRELRTQMNRAHDCIIQRVPLEIVTVIFQCFGSSQQSPLILGAVCKAWRQIAWSTPSIWASIHIDAERHSTPTCRDIARDWLNRSRQLPLTIRLRTPTGNDWYRKRKNEDGLYDLISIISAHSTRWQCLDLEMINIFYRSLCEESQPGNILRTLRLNNPSYSSPLPEFRMPGPKPRPERVELMYFNLRDLHIEWDYVTRTELTWFQIDDALELLKRAPNLRSCTLLISGVPRLDIHFPIPPEPVVHSQITDFTCKFAHVSNHDEAVVTFFDKATLPGLTRFAYVHRQETSRWDYPQMPANAILSFFRRSSCLLRELVIGRCLLIDDELIPILTELPSLHILDISSAHEDTYVPDTFFNLLSKTAIAGAAGAEDKAVLLPELQVLKYTHTSPTTQLAWKNLPDLFGPLSDIDHPGRRPLRTVHIRVPKKDNPLFSFIHASTIHRMLGVLELGLGLQIRDKDTDADLIQASVAYNESVARRVSRRRSNRKC